MSEPQMTKDRLDELQKTKFSGEHQFIALERDVAKQVFTLAREGLRLREDLNKACADYTRLAEERRSELQDITKRLGFNTDESQGPVFTAWYCADLFTAELDSLRKDKERLDWLDSLPDKTEFTPSQYGATLRTAIDSAMRKQSK